MAYAPDPAFQKLFTVFTSDPDSMGAHLARRMVALTADDPMLVTTGTDVVLFPGSGRAPRVENVRKTTRGFIELTAVSHLGLAVPWIIRLRELGDPVWKEDTNRLLVEMERVRGVNSERYWREHVAVAAYAGLEAKIADLVDYSCAVTANFLKRGLADEKLLNFHYLRDHYLDPHGSAEVPVPIDDMMAATFALTFLDIAHRILAWLHAEALDWDRLMIMISGQAGRSTAGLTWATHNMCHLLWQASGQRLSPERLYIAPHAPPLALSDLDDGKRAAEMEATYRRIWLRTRGSVELGREMFAGYPAYRPSVETAPFINADTETVDQMPAARSPDDRRAIITRLRFVMEDPGQLISNAAAQYVIDQLCACGNRPAEVIIPGFTNMTYPSRRI
jgi:hypothetical protein